MVPNKWLIIKCKRNLVLLYLQAKIQKIYCKSSVKILIEDNNITQVSCAKFLGVVMDWAYWDNKVMKSIGIIRRNCGFISQSVLKILYYSLIYPHISYCNIVGASTLICRNHLLHKRHLLDEPPSLIPCLHLPLCSRNLTFCQNMTLIHYIT